VEIHPAILHNGAAHNNTQAFSTQDHSLIGFCSLNKEDTHNALTSHDDYLRNNIDLSVFFGYITPVWSFDALRPTGESNIF
jgi:hypothetical protein